MSEENIKLLKKAGLKITEPRLTILALMQKHSEQHFSAEDVYKMLLENGSDIGLATVYRVLSWHQPNITTILSAPIVVKCSNLMMN